MLLVLILTRKTLIDLTSHLIDMLSRFNESLEPADCMSPVSAPGQSTTIEANGEAGLFSSNQLPNSSGSDPEQYENDGDLENNSNYCDMFDSEIDGLDIEEIIGDMIAAEGQGEDQDVLGDVENHGSQEKVGGLSGGEEPEDMSLEGLISE